MRIEEEKRMPLEYEVVEPEQLPEEAAALVEEKKASEVQGHISERKRALSDQRLRKTDERRIQHSGKRAFSFFHGCIF